ncbi:MAG TPA: cytochrome C oxidase subunit IV family protein [Candidatus Binataceae bacterium]|nr:cytochrome C oxidase subunit IV family protein [Candidatus Binataceae bacterium]
MSAQIQTETAGGAHGESRTLAYVVVAVLLAILTAMEVWISYVHALLPVLVPLLIVLSGAKFALVALFYMHLHYDSWTFSAIFLPALFIALLVVVVLVALMVRFFAGF